ncbi:hypothetical protein [Allohahella sp. A8]|uniref:hypothetical protein n=1 Tax=Allohahella sp. A8 TaxID=3141461 RepID=UPI003A7F8AF6
MIKLRLKRISLFALCISISACGGGSGGSGSATAPVAPDPDTAPGASGGGASNAGDDTVPLEERTDIYAITAVGIYTDAGFLIGDAAFTLADTASTFELASAPTRVTTCADGKGEKVQNTSKTSARQNDERQVFSGDFLQVQYSGCSSDGLTKNGEERLDFTDYPARPAEGEPFAFAAVYRSYVDVSEASFEENGQVDRLVYHTESSLTASDVSYVLTGVNSHLFEQSIGPTFFPVGAAYATPQVQITEDARWIDPQDTAGILAAEIGFTEVNGLERTVSQFYIDKKITNPDTAASTARPWKIQTTSPLVIDEVESSSEDDKVLKVARSGSFIITLETGTVISLEVFDPNGGIVPGSAPLNNVRLRLDRGADGVFEDERWIAWSQFNLLQIAL